LSCFVIFPEVVIGLLPLVKKILSQISQHVGIYLKCCQINSTRNKNTGSISVLKHTVHNFFMCIVNSSGLREVGALVTALSCRQNCEFVYQEM